MSWSVTVDQLQEINDLPDDILAKIAEDNPLYANDAKLAFQCAKQAGLVNASLSGGRTPNPYGGPEVVVIAMTGLDSDKTGHAVPPMSFNEEMQHIINTPPYADEWEDFDLYDE